MVGPLTVSAEPPSAWDKAGTRRASKFPQIFRRAAERRGQGWDEIFKLYSRPAACPTTIPIYKHIYNRASANHSAAAATITSEDALEGWDECRRTHEQHEQHE
jgi:hypothetical protein